MDIRWTLKRLRDRLVKFLGGHTHAEVASVKQRAYAQVVTKQKELQDATRLAESQRERIRLFLEQEVFGVKRYKDAQGDFLQFLKHRVSMAVMQAIETATEEFFEERIERYR